MTVNEVLTHPVIVNLCANEGWSRDLSTYLQSISISISTEIQIRYDKLLALDEFEEYVESEAEIFIADYIYDRISNEVERIYQALTIQYTPKYNYYRNISEENTGEDSHLYGGTDSDRLSGTDNTQSTDSLDIDNNTVKDNSTFSSNTYDSADAQGLRPTDKQENEYQTHEDYEERYNTQTTYGKTNTTTYGKTLRMTYGRNVSTSIEGNNGIYPFPDLIKKEYDLRMKHKLFDTIVSLIVKSVSSGVWDVE